jgi:hypothetical protein
MADTLILLFCNKNLRGPNGNDYFNIISADVPRTFSFSDYRYNIFNVNFNVLFGRCNKYSLYSQLKVVDPAEILLQYSYLFIIFIGIPYTLILSGFLIYWKPEVPFFFFQTDFFTSYRRPTYVIDSSVVYTVEYLQALKDLEESKKALAFEVEMKPVRMKTINLKCIQNEKNALIKLDKCAQTVHQRMIKFNLTKKTVSNASLFSIY